MTKEARWGELVRAWRASGETARAFATSRGVSDSSLRWWEKRLATRSPVGALAVPAVHKAKPPTRSPSLARVVRPGEAAPIPEAGIALMVGELTIVVRRGFDRALLRELVQALAEAR